MRSLAAALVLVAASAAAAPPPRVFKHPEPNDAQGFGANILVAGDRILVCTLHNQGSGRQKGEVGLLDPKTGGLSMRLKEPLPDQHASGDRFGVIMAASGDLLAVGSDLDAEAGGSFEGVVYLYEVPSGKPLRTLRAPSRDPIPNNQNGFGEGLAMTPTLLAVAAPGQLISGTQKGAIFVFDPRSGQLLSTIVAPEELSGSDRFGRTMAIVGGTLLVGAMVDGQPGRVLVYDAATGKPLQTIAAPGGEPGFGAALLPLDGQFLVGAPAEDPKKAGAVHLLDLASGKVLRSFAPPKGDAEPGFGGPLAASGDRLLVGAPSARQGRGAAYLLDLKTGRILATYRRPGGAEGDAFGARVALTATAAYAWAATLFSPLYGFRLGK